jgi:hypothetical protein
MHDDDATNLFEIIEDRTEINSTIITSQLPNNDWLQKAIPLSLNFSLKKLATLLHTFYLP